MREETAANSQQKSSSQWCARHITRLLMKIPADGPGAWRAMNTIRFDLGAQLSLSLISPDKQSSRINAVRDRISKLLPDVRCQTNGLQTIKPRSDRAESTRRSSTHLKFDAGLIWPRPKRIGSYGVVIRLTKARPVNANLVHHVCTIIRTPQSRSLQD